MKHIFRFLPITLLVAGLPAPGCAASRNDAIVSSLTVTAVSIDAFDDKAVKALTAGAKMKFTDIGEQGRVLISDRIFDGFQAGPWKVVVPNGSALLWGFKYKEASIESVAIDDKAGHLKLLAAVGNISRLTSVFGDQPPIQTMTEYDARVKRSGIKPMVNVFVRDEADLKAYLPLLRRWLQADLMGLTGNCNNAELVDACKLAERIVVPTNAYVIGADGSLRGVKVPEIKAALVAIRPFSQ